MLGPCITWPERLRFGEWGLGSRVLAGRVSVMLPRAGTGRPGGRALPAPWFSVIQTSGGVAPGEEKLSSCRCLNGNHLHGNRFSPIRSVAPGGSGERCSPTEVAKTDDLEGHGKARETALIPKGPDTLEQIGWRERGDSRSIELSNF